MRQAVLTCAISTLMTLSAQAAELGDVTVRSHLNEPLRLELGLSGIGQSDTLSVKAGTLDLYRKAGRIQPPEVLGLRVDVVGTSPYRIQITGRNNVAVSSFPLIVEVMHNGSAVRRTYTVKLTERPMSASATKLVKRTEAKKSAASQLKPGSRLVVGKGQTLWGLAKKAHVAYPSVGIDQVVVAMVRHNRACFRNGRIDSLQLGCSLTLPTVKQVRSIAQDTAVALVRVQSHANLTKEPGAAALNKARERLAKTDPIWAERLRKEQLKKVQIQKAPSQKDSTAKTPERTPKVRAEQHRRATEKVRTDKVSGNERQEVRPLPIDVPESKQEKAQPVALDVRQDEAPKVAVAETRSKDRTVLWGWITALLAMTSLAGIGWMLWRRQTKTRQPRIAQEQPIRFMRAEEGMTKEQEQGVESMLANRLEADRVAERGFVSHHRHEMPMQEARTHASIADARESVRDSMPSLPEGQDEKPSVVQEATAEPKLGDISHLRNALTRAMQDQLDTAKEFIQVGAKQQALRVLQQVMQQGNGEQKKEAAELMRMIEGDDKDGSVLS